MVTSTLSSWVVRQWSVSSFLVFRPVELEEAIVSDLPSLGTWDSAVGMNSY